MPTRRPNIRTVNARFKDELDDHRCRLRAWCEKTEDEFLRFCL